MATKTPAEVIDSAMTAGQNKLRLQSSGYTRFAILTILAGIYIAFGGTLSLIIGYGFPGITADNPALQKLLSGAMFPIGLILVVVLGAELFTGNNAMLMPPLIAGKCRWRDVLVNWAVVYLGNFFGALLFVFAMVYFVGLTAPEPYHSAIIGIAKAKVSMPWLVVMVKGIGANWCVCVAIWLAMSAKSSGAKMFGCWLPVMAFVALGYEHSIANMFFIPCGMLEGADVTAWQMVWRNLVPATIGNIIGGALLVGCVHTYLHLKKEA
ncbi:formate/nitrite transporter family protein [Barnesiella sp. WM24]|uniref:formate/nitrite transporter family protein n=1 Tax=Barnesiella sp. WM24 TaxID=2558278 RepID=UPI0010719AD6|nr:formate/nitrite transporter family protein [Barnesiella sp. WM24]TFU93759.1 formate/nitrite transporter family protein [Barnesiella sp. WM24]